MSLFRFSTNSKSCFAEQSKVVLAVGAMVLMLTSCILPSTCLSITCPFTSFLFAASIVAGIGALAFQLFQIAIESDDSLIPKSLFLQGQKLRAAVLPASTQAETITLSKFDATVTLHRSISEIGDVDWEALVPEDKIFLHKNYLQALEQEPPENAEFRYCAIRKDNEVIGVAYFQLLELSLEELGNDVNPKLLQLALAPRDALLGKRVADSKVRVLMCGNALLSGEYGFCYCDSIAPDDAFDGLCELMEKVAQKESREGRITFYTIKDFCPDTPGHALALQNSGYHKLTVEPAMNVTLSRTWKEFSDYMDAMSSKYRQRVRSARKKAKAITRKELQSEDILSESTRIEELFHAVLDKAGFRLSAMRAEGFASLKNALGDSFRFRGYYLEDKMIGFSVALISPSLVDAHLVGIDYEHNRKYATYQNMLYDFVELGIENRCDSVHMGRTALEIKSTVGAVAQDLVFYMRHANPVVNRFLRPLLSLAPTKEWTPRHPFKEPITPAKELQA